MSTWGPFFAYTGVVVGLFAFIWRAIGERLDGVERRMDRFEGRVDAKIDGLEQRVDAKIGALEQRLDERIGGLEQRLGARIGGLADVTDHRLSALETDMTIIKQHLLNTSAA
ncbi:MAG: apolipoprotein A1/A4/E family protein [Nocardioidaceae bacterium]|nr:apolipoprotein A1/A4/E family protein [Nocardioidaceae bacterium]MCL2613137.1 apolipoprotein A1/A4/E family protein [Nocardioidaceae bacterium]